MDHVPHVRLVDAKAKGLGGGTDDLPIIYGLLVLFSHLADTVGTVNTYNRSQGNYNHVSAEECETVMHCNNVKYRQMFQIIHNGSTQLRRCWKRLSVD